MTLLLALSAIMPGLAQTPLASRTAPAARKIHTEHAINGTVLADDYAWLREKSSPEVRQYLEAENSYAENLTADEKPLLRSFTLRHCRISSRQTIPYPTARMDTGTTLAPLKASNIECIAAARHR
jgi:hypothetical protein